VSFRNRTYEGTSSSTLTERRTPLTTPSPSLRMSSEESEAGHEEKAYLLTSSSRHPKVCQKAAKITPDTVRSSMPLLTPGTDISSDFNKPPLMENSLTHDLTKTGPENYDSESETHEYVSIEADIREQIREETNDSLSELSANSEMENPLDQTVHDHLLSLNDQDNQVLESVTETSVVT